MPRHYEEERWRRPVENGVTADERRAERLDPMFIDVVVRDPREAYVDSAGAAFMDFERRFGENLRDLREGNVGAGRVRGGFGGEDERDLFREMGRDLNVRLADRSLQAEGLGLRRAGLIGPHADRRRDQATAAAGGTYMTLRDQRLQEERERRRRRSYLIGSGISALGSIAGAFVDR